jgi:uncharacterized coiled-coil DUF342 family protein
MPNDELKDLIQQAVEEMRRHFDVSNEDVREDVRGVAEAVTALDAKFEREIASVRTEMREGFSETQAMFKFSHAELVQRAGGAPAEARARPG